MKNLLIIAGLVLLVVHAFTGLYDHDEIGHYLVMQNMSVKQFFSPWARGASKIFYPLNADIYVYKVISILLIFAAVFFIYKINPRAVLVFISLPLLIQLGGRFYTEIPFIFLLSLALYLRHIKKYNLYFLILGYLPLIRAEAIIVCLIAVWDKKLSPMIFVFPIIYYLSSIILTGDISYLPNIYLHSVTDVRRSGIDLFHFVKALISLCGLLVFFILPSKDRPFKYSVIGMVGFYCLSYWKYTAFTPNVGIERPIIILSPIVALMITENIQRLKKNFYYGLIFINLMSVPFLKPDKEFKLIEKTCKLFAKTDKIFYEHGGVNLYHNKKFYGSATSRVDKLYEAKSGDYLLWDNHYCARKIKPAELIGWDLVFQQRSKNFVVVIFRKK